MTSVPFVDLKPVTTLVRVRAQEEWARLLEKTQFISGPTIAALEARLADTLGVRHAVVCSSGTDALTIALQALGVGPGKKVALPNLTFWATYEAIAQLGATPVLVDVEPDSLQMDPAELERAHHEAGLDAAVLVHLMGWASARLRDIRALCARLGISLVEDGAQAFGVKVLGSSVFSEAQVSTLSFYPAKVLGGCMDGGAMLTDDRELATLLRTLSNHGRSAHYSHSHVGWNSRMSTLNAAWLLAALDHADEIVAWRRNLEAQYVALCAEFDGKLRVYGPPRGVTGNGYLAVCTVAEGTSQDVIQALAGSGVSCRRVYPETIDAQPPAAAALRVGTLAQSRAFCPRVFNLPLFYGMTEDQFAVVRVALRAALAT